MSFVVPGKPSIILAPMEGVTDYPMRKLLTERGAISFCISEFIRVSQDAIPRKVFTRMVPELLTEGKTESGCPVVVQILGGDPELISQSALNAVSIGALGIDINFGCPAPTVNRHDGGATLLKYPGRIYNILSTLRKSLPKHISMSAKLRLGWDDTNAIFENAKAVEEAGSDWISIHARTRMQGYAPPVHWDVVGAVKKTLSIPVVVNGDITDLQSFKLCREITGCEHYMIGRGILADPGLPHAIAKELGISQSSAAFTHSMTEWSEVLKRFVDISATHNELQNYSLRRVKQWINLASKRHSVPWFDGLKKCSSLEEVWPIFLQSTPSQSINS